jgi:hypothetical protein
MHGFKTFLAEEKIATEKSRVHLSHLEDSILDHGHDGVATAANFLDDAHHMLTGHKPDAHYSTKFDGSPSVIFGQHPNNGQFFVSTKSALSKNAKINHTPMDAAKNHKGNPELIDKLVAALEHLPKIMPKGSKAGDVYQGDLMHTPDSIIHTEDGHIHFKPNTIMYSAPKNSPHGKAASSSKLGIVVHTKHDPELGAVPLDPKSRSKFREHPDVHNIDPTLKVDPSHYTTAEMKAFLQHRDAATKLYRSIKPESMESVTPHLRQLHQHINDQVRKGKKPSVEDFVSFLQGQHTKGLGTLNSDKGKKARTSEHSARLAHIMSKEKDIDKILQLHGHLQKAKDVLTGVMGKGNPWIHSIDGQKSMPEGVVGVAPDGSAVKFVNRKGFSKANFDNAKKKK